MRYQKPLVALIAVVIVATIATLGITSISVTNLMPQSTNTEVGFFLGHVEVIVRDSDGNIKNYFQSDNLISHTGDRCIAELIWADSATTNQGAGEDCSGADFDVIAITNETNLVTDHDTDIGDFGIAGAGSFDIMATIAETVVTISTLTAGAGAAGNDVTITNSGHLFNFNATNATIVEGVLLLDAACGENPFGECLTLPGTDLQEVMAARDATLTVSDGDTLQVTWTITVG